MLPVLGDGAGYLVMATKNGLIKKTATGEFDHILRSGKIAIRISEGDELISVQFATGKDEIVVASHSGKCIRFPETDVRPMGRDTMGVKAMTLSEGDRVVDMLVLREGCDLLTVSENGYGKRTDPEDYRLQSRGGKGIKAGVFNEKTGALVNMKMVTDEDDVMMVTSSGIVIRMHADSISHIGRNTRGVRLMNVRDGIVATVEVTERDEEAEVEAPEETAADLSPDELAEEVTDEETDGTQDAQSEDAAETDEAQNDAPVSEDKDE